ncbi:hypothetical protein [Candidatus Proelusimicrobium volucris]|uniref:hypothetical protein n=1 Tax=Candidatus Proelusimicrobium volucris TaxID=3416225 RepID=UPI003D132953
MPNKDSFTFSDKLKKSKSLPLSKRIPSRVGGDGKAKRTLIQRAQRDLPFIIVAAAALLLLPLLSRNSGTDATGFEGSGYDDFVGESLYDYPSSGDGEIVPSTGYRDPMDYIITNRSGMDTPSLSDSYDSEDTSSYISHAQSSYEEEKPQREIYKNVAKPSIRNAVQRKATAIGAFRNRAMSFGNSSSGLTRNLAIGGAPTTTGTAAARVGVRPVALQPLSSAGKGRVLTGEGLYAEAARSLGALNQGSAKQALFEAQLRDVDGAPLGAAGDPRRAAARIGSQGGVPDHKFGYTNERPWWWDMMKERSQKMWELWNYNWQKALSDSLIKVSTNLAMCLLTGSEDGSVKNFLGIKGGSKDVCCLVDGMELCAGDIGDYTSSTSGSGDSKETTNNSFSSIQSFCDSHGAKTYVSESGAKNALQARLECMGLKAGKLAWASGTQYSGSCEGVNKTPMVYKAKATRKADGKVRSGKQEKIVVYVKAKPRDSKVDTGKSNNEFVIALEKTNDFSLSADELKAINTNCEITRVGSFVSKNTKRRIGKKVGQYNDLNEDSDSAEVKKASEVEARIADIDKELDNLPSPEERTSAQKERYEKLVAERKDLKSGRYIFDDKGTAAGDEESEGEDIAFSDYIRGKVNAQYNYCTGKNAKPAQFIDEDDIMKDIKAKTEIKEVCPIWYSEGQINNQQTNSISCVSEDPVEINALAESSFSVDVVNPKDNIFAIFVEYVQTGAVKDGKLGAIVKEKKNAGGMVKTTISDTVKDGKKETVVRYTVPGFRPGKSLSGSTEEATGKSRPGNGKVFWLMTNKETPLVEIGHVFEGKSLDDITAEDLIGPTAGYKQAQCFYKWGCNGDECPPEPVTGTFCKEDGKLYKAVQVEGYFFRATDKSQDVRGEDLRNYAKSDAECGEDTNKFISKQPQCARLCKHTDTDTYGVSPDRKDLNLKKEVLQNVANDVLTDCEECYPKDEGEQREVEKPGECVFNVSSTFCTYQFTRFGSGNSASCKDMDSDGVAKVQSQTEDLLKCLKGKEMKVGLYGWTSASGGEKNKGLSQARALKVAKIVYEYIQRKDPNLYIEFAFPSDFTGVPGFNRNNKDGYTSEADYIANVKQNYPVDTGENPHKAKIEEIQDTYLSKTDATDAARTALNNYSSNTVNGAAILRKLDNNEIATIEAEIRDLETKFDGAAFDEQLTIKRQINEKNSLLDATRAKVKLTPEEEALPEYQAYRQAKQEELDYKNNELAEARRLSRRLVIYVSGQGASAGSKADEHWAKCIAGKVINDNDYTPQPCRQ